MIVEVSGRQTGKTTRMIEHMAHSIIYGSSSISIVCHSVLLYKHILSRLETKLVDLGGDGWVDCSEHLRHVVKRVYDMMRDDDTFYYVEEFDFLDVDTLTIRDNAYYCTSIGPNSYFTNRLVRYCQSNGIEVYHAQSNQNVIQEYERWGTQGEVELNAMLGFYNQYDLIINVEPWFKKDFTHKRCIKKLRWKTSW